MRNTHKQEAVSLSGVNNVKLRKENDISISQVRPSILVMSKQLMYACISYKNASALKSEDSEESQQPWYGYIYCKQISNDHA